MNYKILRYLNWNNKKELYEVEFENGKTGYVVKNLNDNSEKQFDFWDNELAYYEFCKQLRGFKASWLHVPADIS